MKGRDLIYFVFALAVILSADVVACLLLSSKPSVSDDLAIACMATVLRAIREARQ